MGLIPNMWRLINTLTMIKAGSLFFFKLDFKCIIIALKNTKLVWLNILQTYDINKYEY